MSKPTSSLQGKLILDSGKLAGSFFEKTVILICRHNESGAFGIVLNRPVKKKLGDALESDVSEKIATVPLFLGGPVQPEFLSFLHETEDQPEYDILPCLILGHSLDELKKKIEEEKTTLRTRAFVGYAGWSPGQLENEMKTGAWFTHPGSLSNIFYAKPENLWRHILSQKGGIYQLIADCPPDPTLN
jgi:putative transcriptional regulator